MRLGDVDLASCMFCFPFAGLKLKAKLLYPLARMAPQSNFRLQGCELLDRENLLVKVLGVFTWSLFGIRAVSFFAIILQLSFCIRMLLLFAFSFCIHFVTVRAISKAIPRHCLVHISYT